MSQVDFERCADAGLEVVRRHSGGGAVIVRPGRQVWIDVFVPRGHPLFVDDVVASFGFLGRAWFAALADVLAPGTGQLEVANRGDRPSEWSRMLCFAGLGAGEVTLDGHKIVGISQRRDRSGAWFHSMAPLEVDPFELTSMLVLDAAQREVATAELVRLAGAVPGGPGLLPALTTAVLDHLA
jgi:lipoate---protein ligase